MRERRLLVETACFGLHRHTGWREGAADPLPTLLLTCGRSSLGKWPTPLPHW